MIVNAIPYRVPWASLWILAAIVASGCQKKAENPPSDSPAAMSQQDSIAKDESNPGDASSDSAGSSGSTRPRMLGEDQQRDLVGQLVALGLGSQASDSLFASISADSTQALEYSKTDAEFDGKPGKETVSWWGFQSGSGDAIQRIYWLVISSQGSPVKALAYHLITLPYCDASEQGTASLHVAPWENEIQQALLSKTVALSCGSQLSGATQIDTLRWLSGQAVYREGLSQSLGETDKSEIPE